MIMKKEIFYFWSFIKYNFCLTLSEFECVNTDFDKCHNLSKQNVKLILKILSDLGPFKGLVEQKNVAFNLFVCKFGSVGARFTRVLNWPIHPKKRAQFTHEFVK
jgi:hypothetical protein